jgi:hypothetical protein
MRYDAPYVFFFSMDDNGKDKIEKQIEAFEDFGPGWSFGEGSSFSKEIIQKAILVYRYGKYKGLLAEAFPGLDGDITITFQMSDNFLDVTINEDGSFDIEFEKGIGEEYTSKYLGSSKEFEYVREKIQWLTTLERKHLSEYSTCSISVKGKKDLKRKSSKYPKMERAYQYSTTTAGKKNTNILRVNTSESSMKMLHVYR